MSHNSTVVSLADKVLISAKSTLKSRLGLFFLFSEKLKSKCKSTRNQGLLFFFSSRKSLNLSV
jgi:hypothetical protein